MQIKGYIGGTTPLTQESEGVWEGFFQDSPGPGDHEATLTGAQMIADELGNPKQQAIAQAAGASGLDVPIASGIKATGSALSQYGWLAENLPLVLLVLVALVFVLLAMGGGVSL